MGRAQTVGLAIASLTGILGGSVWLAILARGEGPDRAAAVLDSGETPFAEQIADPHFDPSVPHPAYVTEHPKVAIDEAHRNFHRAEGTYKPLADLLRADGYEVGPNTAAFAADVLQPFRVLVIAHALGDVVAETDTPRPAFTQAECDAVHDWVRDGGSLLLVADHAPFGGAAEIMGRAFDVQMGKGFVYSLDANYAEPGHPSDLIFSRENGLLGDHPIQLGRSGAERVNRIVAFTGQSLSVPPGATALMKLSPVARESPNRGAPQREREGTERPRPPAGSAQGLALRVGKGRVVVLGEAALLTAQVWRTHGGKEEKFGMNAQGNDDRQFALNVLHWLTGLLS